MKRERERGERASTAERRLSVGGESDITATSRSETSGLKSSPGVILRERGGQAAKINTWETMQEA